MLAQNVIRHMFGVVGWHHTALLHMILSVMCTVILQMDSPVVRSAVCHSGEEGQV